MPTKELYNAKQYGTGNPLQVESAIRDGSGNIIENYYAKRNTIDIGQEQETYDALVFPKITKSKSTEIYNSFTSGVYTIIKWNIIGVLPLEFAILATDNNGESKTFDILVHDKYICSYSYSDSQVETYATLNIKKIITNDALQNIFQSYQITNQAITLGEMKTINDGINTRGEHVFYDVASLGANMYVCTFFTDGNTYEIMDLVSQRVIRGAYDSTKLLTICLAGADYVATQKQIDNLQEQIDELGGKKVLENWEALADLIQSGESQSVISAGDTIYVNWIKTVIGSTTSGLTVTCSDMNKFITKLGKAEEDTYFFVYNGSTWTYNDEAITLSEWGLSVSGSVPTGEVMTINTTVDKVSYTFTGYDDVTAKEAGASHNWLLEQTYAPTTKAYDTYESLFNLKANSSLSAGKYKATLHSYHGSADITFYVNIPSAVNAGAKVVQFGSTGYKQVDLSGNKYVPKGVIPYVIDTTTGLQAEITCEYSVADPSSYTDLSTLSQIELPLCLDHSFFGSNVWPESNIRAWLNNTGEGYTAPYKFDRPSSYNMGKGFLWGIDPRVLNVMLTAKVKWTAGLGSDYTQNQTYESEDKVFLLSMKEMSFNINTAEGNVSDLYDEYVIAEKGESMLTNDPIADRAKYNQAGGSKNSYRWSRSAHTSYAVYSRLVSSTGANDNRYAYHSTYFAPAFIVGKAS